MKVLRQVCQHCGFISLFSVEILCTPGRTEEDFGVRCPSCDSEQAPVFWATEIDMEEINPEPVDIEALRRSIQRELGLDELPSVRSGRTQ